MSKTRVNSPPLLHGENHRLSLAPFATVYDGLASHMIEAGVVPLLSHNCWDQPIAVTGGGAGAAAAESDGGAAAAATATGWSLQPPARFLPFHVPMDIPSSTARGEGIASVCELPAAYSTALLSHVQRLGRFRDELQALTCTEEMRREVQAAVQSSFGEWLQRTGNARQLTDLMAQASW